MNMQTQPPKDNKALIVEDLARSGLVMNQDLPILPMDQTIVAAAALPKNAEGYGIVYYNINGNRLPFYRVRLLGEAVKEETKRSSKYKQVKNTKNHIYFPRDFQANFAKMKRKLVIITEGEKKAAALNKIGFAAVGLSGVDSWRNRLVLIPKNIEQEPYPHSKNMLMLKIDPDQFSEYTSGFAEGFDDLCELMVKNQTTAVIIFDDPHYEDNPSTQKAAARLGHELRARGMPLLNIRQTFLPGFGNEKMGVDDYLMHERGGAESFKKLIHETLNKPSAFPPYPQLREYLSKQLSKPRITRKNYQELALAVVTDLDRRGKRMFAPDEDQLYYFDQQSKHLMKVHINEDMRSSIHETEFGRLLYRDYDISPIADGKVVQWMGAQMSAEAPIEDVNPSRIISRPKDGEDCVRFQLNDGQFIKITGNADKPFQLLENGQDSTLFASEGLLPISGEELVEALNKVSKMPVEPWWFDVLNQVKLKERGNAAMAMGLLYYVSPWLYRWRGTQLPIEMVCGESGSGKSTLVSLRLNILTGQASLKNAPTDLKDWYASITKSGGMHVTDNLHFTDKQLAQRMSDELCRLVTEPNPAIEQRKYFTNADVIKFPINAIFSFTAIKQPFNNADLIQRSFILELDKVQALETDNQGEIEVKDYAFDGYWLQHQLERFGGRTMWVAHHLWVLHKFFNLVQTKWDNKYKAKYRLINLEQALVVMSEVFGMEEGREWIPNYLSSTTNKVIEKSDWTLNGLKAYADHRRKHEMEADFSAADISQWCNAQEDYEENNILSNARALGRYLQTAKYNIATIAGILESRRNGNKQFYNITKPKIGGQSSK